MNIIARVAAVAEVVAPATMLNYYARRWALDSFLGIRKFDAARLDRRTDNWLTSNTSANAEIGPATARIRSRARDLVQNNALARNAKRQFTTSLVASGITARAKSDNEETNKAVNDLWHRWCCAADADGNLDFHAIQAQIVGSVVVDGEVLVRFRRRRLSDGLPVPLQLQVLEADFLNTMRDGPRANGNIVVHGIEFDRIGRRVAYHLFQNHPGNTTAILRNSLQSHRVPASEIMHIYDVERPGQARGVSWFAPVVIKLRDLDEYDEAELVRKKIESCLAVFVTQPGGPEGPSLAPRTTENLPGGGTRRKEKLSPGMIEYLRQGEEIKTAIPAGTPGFGEYVRVQQHLIAAGVGLTYELLTGDLEKVNFSSIRAGMIPFRTFVRQKQDLMLRPMFLAKVWNMFTSMAHIAGLLETDSVPVEWSRPAFEEVDRLKSAQADTLELRNGMQTFAQMVHGKGHDPDEQIAAIAEGNKKIDEAGLVLDGDPRKVTKTGTPTDKKGFEDAEAA